MTLPIVSRAQYPNISLDGTCPIHGCPITQEQANIAYRQMGICMDCYNVYKKEGPIKHPAAAGFSWYWYVPHTITVEDELLVLKIKEHYHGKN